MMRLILLSLVCASLWGCSTHPTTATTKEPPIQPNGPSMTLEAAARVGNLPELNLNLSMITDGSLEIQGALFPASEYGHVEIVKALLKHGGSASTTNGEKEMPLHYAAMGGSVPVARVLLENGADINAEDSQGFTPLKNAQYGKDNFSQSPQIVAKYGNPDWAAMIEFLASEAGSSPDDPNALANGEIAVKVVNNFKGLLRRNNWKAVEQILSGTGNARAQLSSICHEYREKLIAFPIVPELYSFDWDGRVLISLAGPNGWEIHVNVDPKTRTIGAIHTNDD